MGHLFIYLFIYFADDVYFIPVGNAHVGYLFPQGLVSVFAVCLWYLVFLIWIFILSFLLCRYTSRFRDILTNCSRTWAFYTIVWCLYGLAVHWGGIWRLDIYLCVPRLILYTYMHILKSCYICRKGRSLSFRCGAWETLSCLLWWKPRGYFIFWFTKVRFFSFSLLFNTIFCLLVPCALCYILYSSRNYQLWNTSWKLNC